MIKTITICGQRKLEKCMEFVKRYEERKFNIVHMPNFSYSVTEISILSEEELSILHEQHYQKIEHSDYVIVVTKDHYIGDDTRREICYAQLNNIPVRYINYSGIDCCGYVHALLGDIENDIGYSLPDIGEPKNGTSEFVCAKC